jgi:hypothetical protein
MPIDRSELTKKIDVMVARRAFQISEGRGFAPGQELRDWQCAESEVVGPLSGGFMEGSEGILVSAPASCFEKGAIEIGIEPRRVAIFGKQRTCAGTPAVEGNYSKLQGREIVRVLNLPVEVEPTAATARFSHCMLEIALPKTRSRRSAGASPQNA